MNTAQLTPRALAVIADSGETGEPIFRTPCSVGSGGGEVAELTELRYSLDEENYCYDDLAEALCRLDDDGNLVEGAVVYEGDALSPTASYFFSMDRLTEDLGERAYDECGEWAEDFPDTKTVKWNELEAIIKAWLDANVAVHFWTVTASRKIEVTAEMIAEHNAPAAIAAATEGAES